MSSNKTVREKRQRWGYQAAFQRGTRTRRVRNFARIQAGPREVGVVVVVVVDDVLFVAADLKALGCVTE